MLKIFVIFFTICVGMSPRVIAAQLVADNRWSDQAAQPTRIAFNEVNSCFYVSSPASDEIAVLDTVGQLVSVINSVTGPCAIACGADGNVAVQSGNRICLLSASGLLLTDVCTIADSCAIHDIAIGPDDRVFVSVEYHGPLVSDSVFIFTAAGERVGGFRGFGRYWQYLDIAVSIEVNAHRQEVLLVDQNHSRVLRFGLDGTPLGEWGSLGSGLPTAGQFLRAWGMACDSQDRIWVWDEIQAAVHIFDYAGLPLYYLPAPLNAIRTGVDIAVRGDRMYLTSAGSDCIEIFRLSTSGGQEPADTLAGLTISPAGNSLMLRWPVTADAVRYRVLRAATPEFASAETEMLAEVTDTMYTDFASLSERDIAFYRVEPIIVDGAALRMLTLEQVRGTDPGTYTHERPHRIQDGVECVSCHFSTFAYPNPLPEWWFGDVLCKGCHVETGMATPEQNHLTSSGTFYCNACHDPHRHQSQFPRYFVRDVIDTPSGSRIVSFNNASDFIHGAPAFDGICEVCHTQTEYHRNSTEGDHAHQAESNCLDCHEHRDGFLPTTE